MAIDISVPDVAYMYGFILADGSLYEGTRNRGRLSVEISYRDEYLLQEFARLIPFNCYIKNRNRNTNFGEIDSSILTVCSLEFRKELKGLGYPVGCKHTIEDTPNTLFSERDFWRGYLDANGSIGISGENRPFVSLGTASDSMAEEYKRYVYKLISKENNTNRNKRDNFYNIVYYNEYAQGIAKELYYTGCLALKRKVMLAEAVLGWVRPENIRKRTWESKKWEEWEDKYVLSHNIEESLKTLKRTKKSISIRLYRLAGKQY